MADLPERVSFPKEEEKVLALWKELDAFKTSLRLSEGKPPYTFYDGPPFATGLPHYGHILAGTIKDTVTRYASQTGHYVSRRFGWDCHGLPVEYEIDQKLGITSPDQVAAMGIATYNSHCRSIVSRYCTDWESIVTRLGRWIDFKNDYKTMEPWYMESVWWVFKTIFEKGLVYRGFKVMPYSTVCHTPLSNFEANLNYKDTSDPAVVVTFPLVSEPAVSLVAWTTTPWTLPSNLALCVNPELTYVRVADTKTGKVYILMEARLCQLYPKLGTPGYKGGEFEVQASFPGSTLVGTQYTPLFPYFAHFAARGAFKVVSDGYVSNDAGTGIVHQAPAFGEDDFRVCCAAGIVDAVDVPCPVDDSGLFTSVVSDFVGQYVKAADDDICKYLKAQGRLVSKGSLVHSYPFCWRSDSPLIYKAVPSWFVKVEAIKEQLLANNELTHWVPAFVKEKRFHNWLKDARDWAISRNRYWGTPLPIWTSSDGAEVVVVGSIEELEALTGVKVTDLHRESIDGLEIPSKTGRGVLRRVPEVFDCWFESGSMPYAQVHYPFNKEVEGKWDSLFPADFIAEGLDQTRGWFYTLMVLSTALFGKPAFKNLIVNGLVLAEDGKKMSKRLHNYPDPILVVNSYGADALRLYLINSPVVKAEPLKFQEAGVFGVVKTVFLPWYNAFRFFMQNVYRLQRAGIPFNPLSHSAATGGGNVMDRWILAALADLVQFVHTEMAAYRLYTVVPRLLQFIDQLTNWYVRLNRRRLKGGDGAAEAVVSLCVLYEVLMSLCRLMAPFTPFFTETLYQHLRPLHPSASDPSAPEDAVGKALSVHYLSIPEVDAAAVDPTIVLAVTTLREVIEAGRVVRTQRNLTARLPVTEAIVVSADPVLLGYARSLESYIKEELNALEVKFTAEDSKWCALKASPIDKVLGKRLGPAFKTVLPKIKELPSAAVQSLLATGTITVEGHAIALEEVNVSRVFMGDTSVYDASGNPDGTVLVVLNHVLTDEVKAMGLTRELISLVQSLRKSSKLSVSDAVEVLLQVEPYDAVKAGAVATPAPPLSIAPTCSVKVPKSKPAAAAAGKPAAAPAPAPAPAAASASSAVEHVKAVFGQGFATTADALGLPIAPALPETVPASVVSLGKSVSELGGALVTLVVARPFVRFASDDVLAALNPAGGAAFVSALKTYVSSLRFDKVKAAASLALKVDGASVSLLPGVHYFLDSVSQAASVPAVQAALAAAGYGDYLAAVKK